MNAPIPPYGVAIHEAIATGDVSRMKQAAQDAENHIAEVRAALDKLYAEMDNAGNR